MIKKLLTLTTVLLGMVLTANGREVVDVLTYDNFRGNAGEKTSWTAPSGATYDALLEHGDGIDIIHIGSGTGNYGGIMTTNTIGTITRVEIDWVSNFYETLNIKGSTEPLPPIEEFVLRGNSEWTYQFWADTHKYYNFSMEAKYMGLYNAYGIDNCRINEIRVFWNVPESEGPTGPVEDILTVDCFPGVTATNMVEYTSPTTGITYQALLDTQDGNLMIGNLEGGFGGIISTNTKGKLQRVDVVWQASDYQTLNIIGQAEAFTSMEDVLALPNSNYTMQLWAGVHNYYDFREPADYVALRNAFASETCPISEIKLTWALEGSGTVEPPYRRPEPPTVSLESGVARGGQKVTFTAPKGYQVGVTAEGMTFEDGSNFHESAQVEVTLAFTEANPELKFTATAYLFGDTENTDKHSEAIEVTYTWQEAEAPYIEVDGAEPEIKDGEFTAFNSSMIMIEAPRMSTIVFDSPNFGYNIELMKTDDTYQFIILHDTEFTVTVKGLADGDLRPKTFSYKVNVLADAEAYFHNPAYSSWITATCEEFDLGWVKNPDGLILLGIPEQLAGRDEEVSIVITAEGEAPLTFKRNFSHGLKYLFTLDDNGSEVVLDWKEPAGTIDVTLTTDRQADVPLYALVWDASAPVGQNNKSELIEFTSAGENTYTATIPEGHVYSRLAVVYQLNNEAVNALSVCTLENPRLLKNDHVAISGTLQSGIESITVTGDAEVRYFDLMGRPVAEPQEGQAVIRVTTDGASKIIR